MSAPTESQYLTDEQVFDLNQKHGWFEFGDAQSDVSRAFANDAIAMYERLRSAAPELLGAVEHAEAWVRDMPHGDNCYLSAHYDGDPGNGCNCGKEGLLNALQTAIAKTIGDQP